MGLKEKEPLKTSLRILTTVHIILIPCIRLACEDSLHEGLRWHPFDRQHGAATFPVIAGSKKQKENRI